MLLLLTTITGSLGGVDDAVETLIDGVGEQGGLLSAVICVWGGDMGGVSNTNCEHK